MLASEISLNNSLSRKKINLHEYRNMHDNLRKGMKRIQV